MPREVKFRGKTLKTNKWIYGDLVQNKEINNYQIIDYTSYGKEILKDTIGQYTGLHDKNEKEIYEGDIVEYAELLKYIVYFGEYNINPENCAEAVMIGFYLKGIKGKSMQEETIEKLYSIDGIASKFPKYCVDNETSKEAVDNLKLNVIGNIYENPELLKGADNIE